MGDFGCTACPEMQRSFVPPGCVAAHLPLAAGARAFPDFAFLDIISKSSQQGAPADTMGPLSLEIGAQIQVRLVFSASDFAALDPVTRRAVPPPAGAEGAVRTGWQSMTWQCKPSSVRFLLECVATGASRRALLLEAELRAEGRGHLASVFFTTDFEPQQQQQQEEQEATRSGAAAEAGGHAAASEAGEARAPLRQRQGFHRLIRGGVGVDVRRPGIFLSYRRSHYTLAHRIALALRTHGFPVFFDTSLVRIWGE